MESILSLLVSFCYVDDITTYTFIVLVLFLFVFFVCFFLLFQETKTIKAMSLTVQADLKGKDKRFENVIIPFMAEAESTLKLLADLYP